MLDDATMGALFGAAGAAIAITVVAFVRKPAKCEKCGAEQPKFRKPQNFNQAMWGGYTCAGCGSELNARGKLRKT